MCRNRNKLRVTTPIIRNNIALHQFIFNTLKISSRFINLIDRNNDWNACSFSMFDCFNGLRHNTVISCYNQNHYVS